jgi:hypothetical protein
LLQQQQVQFVEDDLFSNVDKCIMEEGWLHILKNLNQWDLVYEVASEFKINDLQVQAAFHTRAFESLEPFLKELPPSSWNSVVKAAHALKQTEPQSTQEVSSLITQGFQQALQEFQNLPSALANAHQPLLLNLQLLMELDEANSLMNRIKEPVVSVPALI